MTSFSTYCIFTCYNESVDKLYKDKDSQCVRKEGGKERKEGKKEGKEGRKEEN